eukprot:jgi/Botrbrau1/7050/Bobra.0165s0073.1
MGGRAACSTCTCKHVYIASSAVTSRRISLLTLTLSAAILVTASAQDLTYADLVAKVSSSPSVSPGSPGSSTSDANTASSSTAGTSNGPVPSPPAGLSGAAAAGPQAGSSYSGASPSPAVPPSPAGGPSSGSSPSGEPPQPGSSPGPSSPSPDGLPQANVSSLSPGTGQGTLVAAGPSNAQASPPPGSQAYMAAAPAGQTTGNAGGTSVPSAGAAPAGQPSGGTNADPLAGALPADTLRQYNSAGQTSALNIPTSVGAAEARQTDIPPGTDPQTAAMLRVQAAAQQQLGISGGAPAPSTSPNQPDVDALAAFSAGITNLLQLQAEGLKGWGTSTNPCVGWTGVSCNEGGRVTSIDLGGWLVRAKLTPALVGLDHLKSLNMSMCQLVGPLPPEWGNNSAWRNLTILDLSYNPTIGGGLPDEWGGNTSFHSLTTMVLRSTGIVGGLPLGWGVPGSFPLLSFLDVSDNALEGGLPEVWATDGALPKLQTLLLSNNTLEGGLPPAWGASNISLASLGVLDLSDNDFVGQLPETWGPGMPALYELHLQNNALVGPLPASWGARTSWRTLGWLDLHGNQLTGNVPATWAPLTALHKLHALVIKPGNPDMCGPLPQRFSSITFDVGFAPINSTNLVACAVLHPSVPALAPEAGAAVSSRVAPAPVARGPALAVSHAAVPPSSAAGVGAEIENVVPDGTATSITLDDPLFAGSGTTSQPITRPKPAAPAPQAAKKASLGSPARAPGPLAGGALGAAGGPSGAADTLLSGDDLVAAVSPLDSPSKGPASSKGIRSPFRPAPGPAADGGPAAYLQAQYNLTGFGLLPASPQTRKIFLNSFKKAVDADLNATLVQVEDITPEATEDPDIAGSATPDAASAGDAGLVGLGRRRRLILAAPSVAGVGNAPRDPALVSPDDTAASAAAAAAQAAASFGLDPGAAGAQDPAAAARGRPAAGGGSSADASESQVTRDTVLTTFIIFTTPKNLLSMANEINDTAITKKFTKNLVKAGFEGTKAKLVDLSMVQPDGTLAPLPQPPPSPPPPPVAAGWSFNYDSGFEASSGEGSGDGSASPKLFGFWPSSLGAFIVVFVLLPLALIAAGGLFYYFRFIRGRGDKPKGGNTTSQPGPKSVEMPKAATLPNQTESETSSEDGLGKQKNPRAPAPRDNSADSLADAANKDKELVVISNLSPAPSDLISSPEGSLTESDIKPIIPTKSSKAALAESGICRTRSGGAERELRGRSGAVVPRSAERPRGSRQPSFPGHRGDYASPTGTLERTRGASGSGGVNLEKLAREMQAFEQDLLRQEQMMRAGSGNVRQVDFDPLGDPYMQGPSHPRRNSSREELNVGRGLTRVPSRGFGSSGRDNNEHRLRSLERELGLRPPVHVSERDRDCDVLANARAILEDMEGGRGSALARSRSGMSMGSARGGSDKGRRSNRSPQ